MTSFHEIVGQDRVIHLLTRMVNRGRIPHAMLFTGIDGSGRQTTAKALAMVLNCSGSGSGRPCGHCGPCRKMISGNHPDVIGISPAGAAIKIDQIRSLRKQLRFVPVEGGRRMIVVNDAHLMNPEASNAMLKTLEEPPTDTYLILTAPEPADLMETIVSRCQHIAFRPLSEEAIIGFLQKQKDLNEEAARCVAALAKGSLGKALLANAEKWMNRRNTLLARLLGLSKASYPSLFDFAEELSRDKDRLQEQLDLISIWFRDLLVWKFCPDNIVNKDYGADIEQTSEQWPSGEIIKKLAAVTSAQRDISRNANRRLVLDVMMMQLGSIVKDPPSGKE